MSDVRYLNQKGIDDFVAQLDQDNDGCISYTELEHKLDQVYKELQREAKPHHLHHGSRTDHKRHEFLRAIIGTKKDKIPAAGFKKIVASWQILSMGQEKQAQKPETD